MPIGVASADDCPDVEVVFARGTNDAPGLGNVGDAFVGALRDKVGGRSVGAYAVNYPASFDFLAAADGANDASAQDRKSTRLNSSHLGISYAVFCLKKKKKN